MSAQKGSAGCVVVTTTYGPITNKIEEPAGHLRHFWSELGRVLDEVEKGDA